MQMPFDLFGELGSLLIRPRLGLRGFRQRRGGERIGMIPMTSLRDAHGLLLGAPPQSIQATSQKNLLLRQALRRGQKGPQAHSQETQDTMPALIAGMGTELMSGEAVRGAGLSTTAALTGPTGRARATGLRLLPLLQLERRRCLSRPLRR